MLGLLFSSIFVTNIVFARFLGICPYVGVSKKTSTAFGMGAAVTFVMLISSIVTYFIYGLLDSLGLGFLSTIVFILVIASLVQLLEIIIKKLSPVLHKSLGIYLPLITTNCAILGVALLNIQNKYSFGEVIAFSIGTAVGFTLALVLFASIRERLELANIPEVFKGVPIAFIVAGLLAMAFMGFSGLV